MQTPKSNKYDQLRSTVNAALSKTSQAPTTKTPLNTYIIGQILKGEVIDLQHKDIKILLSNGQLLRGSLEDSIALSISDHADFVVTDIQSSNLVLKLLSDSPSSTPNATIDKALEEANLVKTERNVSVVNELLKQHMSIDKNTIQTVLRQCNSFKNASLETIVQMNKHQIPLTNTNTTQFEAYRNFEHRLLDQVKTLSTSLMSDLSRMDPDTTNQLHQDLLNLVNGDANLQGTPATIQADPSIIKAGQLIQYEQPNQQEQLIQQKQLMQHEQRPQHEHRNASNPITLTDAHMDESVSSGKSENPIQTSMKTLLDTELQQPIEHQINKEYKSALENLLLKSFTLSTDQLLEPNGISKFYEKAEEQLEELNQFITQLENSGSENKFHATSQNLNHMKDNLDFMKVMNQFFGYVQLPMKLPTQCANSELFVYTNKKQLLDGNKNISVLLHLDMEHLGPIDFHLSLNQQQVLAKVGLVNEASLTLIENNLPQLQDALETKGYSFQYELQQIEEETNVVRTYFDENSSDIVMKRYTFDKRA